MTDKPMDPSSDRQDFVYGQDVDPALAPDLAAYIADMALTLADLAAQARLPVTSALLRAAGDCAREEAND